MMINWLFSHRHAQGPTLLSRILFFSLLLLPSVVGAQVQVRVMPVISAVITEQLPLSGSILSPRVSDLSTQESGLVIAMNVESGDRVEEGDVLLRLDAAQTNLEADESADPVAHPLVEVLFTSFQDGRYERSDARLRGWEID